MEPTERRIEDEITPELVERVENSKLNVEDKVNLLLIKAGIKPSSSMQLTIRDAEGVSLTDDELKNIEDIIKDSGLPFRIGEKEIDTYEQDDPSTGERKKKNIETEEILVGRSEKELQEILEITERMPTMQQVENGEYAEEQRNADYKASGLAFGYPESAINAFVGEGGRKCLTTEEEQGLPEDVKKSEAFAFSIFALSKDNWQEEIKQGQIWADCIKLLSPKIYNDMMDLAKNVRLGKK